MKRRIKTLFLLALFAWAAQMSANVARADVEVHLDLLRQQVCVEGDLLQFKLVFGTRYRNTTAARLALETGEFSAMTSVASSLENLRRGIWEQQLDLGFTVIPDNEKDPEVHERIVIAPGQARRGPSFSAFVLAYTDGRPVDGMLAFGQHWIQLTMPFTRLGPGDSRSDVIVSPAPVKVTIRKPANVSACM